MAPVYNDIVRVFKAFCDENRLAILDMLRTGEKCACDLLEELHITQPTLSHHMKILYDAGIVDSRKEGKWTHYKISNEGRSDIIKLLEEITKIKGSYADNCL